MSGHSSYQPSTGIERWIDSRLPLPRMIYDSFVAYPVPRNLNYAYTFGAMLAVMLIVQILTGVVLALITSRRAKRDSSDGRRDEGR